MTNLMRASLRAALATTILTGGAFALAMPAAAQTTSTIQGHVDGAAPGATVVLTDQNTGHQDTVTVDANGNYVLVGVPPSTYRRRSVDTLGGMPPCVAKQVTRPIRNREAPVTGPHLA